MKSKTRSTLSVTCHLPGGTKSRQRPALKFTRFPAPPLRALCDNGTIGRLTLSANSILDMGNYNIGADFADLVMGIYNLSIYNWTGKTLWGGGNGVGDQDRLYFGGASDSELGRISFYSGFNSGFLGTGFDLGLSNQIIPVPEPETWAAGILLVLGGAVWLWRKRSSLTTEFTENTEEG